MQCIKKGNKKKETKHELAVVLVLEQKAEAGERETLPTVKEEYQIQYCPK